MPDITFAPKLEISIYTGITIVYRMPRKIPPEEVVAEKVREIVSSGEGFMTQTLLLREVRKALRKIDEDYVISPRRMRRIALRHGVKVDIEYRQTDRPLGKLKSCPVCGGELKVIRNVTLDGGIVPFGVKCPLCGYWSGNPKRVPGKYVFHM